ncbi:sodium-coupled monocarboxylate transporter 1-like [Amphiura filiformis]|uniref:sodium-coupled monocarboxylate transporter 1-like n=1 Tax=Amphiura filiformis TaxID=82378 RepID=UPI003B219FD4
MAADIAPAFGVVDYILFILLLCVSTSIGLYFACRGGRQRTTEEYLMADRSLQSFPVAMSLLASFMSAITILGIPAEVYKNGTMWWWFALSHVTSVWITVSLFMPMFYKLKLVSVNAYLELRFNRVARLCGTVIFYIHKCLYLGTVVYAPCLALSTVTGMSFEGCVLLVVVICTFYTTIGGLKAVVWTDVFQMSVALIGFIAILIKGSIDHGGFTNIWRINQDGGRIEFWNFSPDPRVRHTFWGISFGGTFIWLFIDAINQYQVQRYLACKSLNTAKWALYLYGIGLVLVTTLPCLAAVVIYAYYHKCDPKSAGRISRDDEIMAYLVIDIFRGLPGLPGLFVSSCFSAALSTMSSGLNSLAALTGEDIVKAIWPNISEKRYNLVNKVTVVAFGIFIAGMAFIADALGKIVQTVMSFTGILGGPMLGVFGLGLFTTRANSMGTSIGFATSVIFGLWLSIGSLMYPATRRALPLSTEGCEESDMINSTFTTWSSMYTETTMTPSAEPTMEDEGPRSGVLGFYSLSYTWYSCVLCTIAMSVGYVASIIKDWKYPENKEVVDPRLVVPISDAFSWCIVLLPAKWRQKLGFDDNKTKDQESAVDAKYHEIAMSDGKDLNLT